MSENETTCPTCGGSDVMLFMTQNYEDCVFFNKDDMTVDYDGITYTCTGWIMSGGKPFWRDHLGPCPTCNGKGRV